MYQIVHFLKRKLLQEILVRYTLLQSQEDYGLFCRFFKQANEKILPSVNAQSFVDNQVGQYFFAEYPGSSKTSYSWILSTISEYEMSSRF